MKKVIEKAKKILHRILFPGTAVVILSILAGTGLLIYTFVYAGEESPIAYISYVFSAYALVIVCANGLPLLQRFTRWFKGISLVSRYMNDISFKINVSLHLSLMINLAYVAMHGISGARNRSFWSGTLAVYYLCLTVMRFLLVRYAHKQDFGENKEAEWKWYRICGVVLMIMNLALAGVVVLVLKDNRGFHYSGFLIYVMAMYAFYVTVMGIVNVVRYRKYNSPVMTAAKIVNLAAALVSMLSLETAMLSQFGDDSQVFFRTAMIGISGGAAFAIVVGIGIYMIVHGGRQLDKMKYAPEQQERRENISR